MAQPQWITPSGSLGVIPEGVYYSVPVQATAGNDSVFFKLIAGQLPQGIQVTPGGFVEGVPASRNLNTDITSKFAIRAYTVRTINGRILVDRLADRTFSLTVAGPEVPNFITPPGNIATYFDGTQGSVQVQIDDPTPSPTIRYSIISGKLPPGMVLDPKTGEISGLIKPYVGSPDTANPGFSSTGYDQYGYDFSTRASDVNYQFVMEIRDGERTNTRMFEIMVYARSTMTADNAEVTADNVFITADVIPTRPPVITTPEGSLGTVRGKNNFFAFKFDAINWDGGALEFIPEFTLPPNLILDNTTGWLYGYLLDQGDSEVTYDFAIRARVVSEPDIISKYYFYSLTVIGDIETQITWLTPSDLGTINNGSVSMLSVQAINASGRELQYQVVYDTEYRSKLPQGLKMLPSGNIVGKVAFNTFCLDGGLTTFDQDRTTFDMEFDFLVNAYAPTTSTVGYRVTNIVVIDGGTGYTTDPTVTISAPPNVYGAVQATISSITRVNGVIVAITIGNPGSGYTAPPTITISGGGGQDAVAIPQIAGTSPNPISVYKWFKVRVVRKYNEPYEKLYIKAMPPRNDRQILANLLENQDFIPVNYVYRADDPNFGVARSVIYDHAYGLAAASLDDYVRSLYINHYRKNLILGEVKTARALDANGNVVYEVVYSHIVDDLVNKQGQSVSKSITWPYKINYDGAEITTVYPNSLINMRDQVIDTVGQIAEVLPLWMTSKQSNGRVLGFVPAWVIAYVKPGNADRIAYNIREYFRTSLNKIDFAVDRYELDRSQTYNWEPYNDSTELGRWEPSPPAATTFDLDATIFDDNGTRFISPSNIVSDTDAFDKYLLFPRTNILG